MDDLTKFIGASDAPINLAYRLAQDNNKLRDTVAAKREETEALRHEVDTLSRDTKASLAHATSTRTEHARLKEELKRALRDFQTHAGRASAVAGATDDLLARMQQTAAECTTTQQAVDGAAGTAAELIGNLAITAAQSRVLKENVRTLLVQRHAQKPAMEALAQRKAGLEQALCQAKTSASEMKARLTLLQNKCASLDAKLASDNSIAAHADEERAGYERATAQQRLQAQETELMCTSIVTAAADAVRALRLKLSTEQQVLEEKTKALADKRQQLADTQAKTTMLEDSVAELMGHSTAARMMQIAAVREEAATLKSKIIAVESDALEAQAMAGAVAERRAEVQALQRATAAADEDLRTLKQQISAMQDAAEAKRAQVDSLLASVQSRIANAGIMPCEATLDEAFAAAAAASVGEAVKLDLVSTGDGGALAKAAVADVLTIVKKNAVVSAARNADVVTQLRTAAAQVQDLSSDALVQAAQQALSAATMARGTAEKVDAISKDVQATQLVLEEKKRRLAELRDGKDGAAHQDASARIAAAEAAAATQKASRNKELHAELTDVISEAENGVAEAQAKLESLMQQVTHVREANKRAQDRALVTSKLATPLPSRHMPAAPVRPAAAAAHVNDDSVFDIEPDRRLLELTASQTKAPVTRRPPSQPKALDTTRSSATAAVPDKENHRRGSLTVKHASAGGRGAGAGAGGRASAAAATASATLFGSLYDDDDGF